MKPSMYAGLAALALAAGSALAAPQKAPVPAPSAPSAKPAAKAAAKSAPKAQPKPKLPKGVVATVNGTPIFEKDVDARLWRRGGASETDAQVNKVIIRMEAKKRGLQMTKAQVQQEYNLQKQRFVSGPGRTPADWDKLVKRYGKADLMDDIEIQALATKIGEAEAKKVKLTAEEVKKADQDLERNAHQVHARHILVSVAPQAPNRSDEDAKKRVKEAQDKLAAGTKWEDVAKEYSDDPTNKDRGGDLGFFAKGQMVKEFEDAAFSLKKDEITPNPVKTSFGYHLIQVLEVKDNPVTEADKKKAEDEALARKQDTAKNPALWFQKVKDTYKIETRMPFE